MPHCFVRARRERSPRSVHLRLARRIDVGDVAAFCERHCRDASSLRPRAASELRALLRGSIDTVIVAWREGEVLGVSLCGVTRGRARLLELLVRPGVQRSTIERRLVRRTLQHLRARGLPMLEFDHPATDDAEGHPHREGPAPLAEV